MAVRFQNTDLQERWPHQQRGLDGMSEAIDCGYRRICVTSPTGGGKTRMGCDWIVERQVPTVWYTHRKMLMTQTAERFREAGIRVGIRASKHRPDLLSEVQIAMIQSEAAAIKAKRRMYHFAADVLVDEAHQNKAQTASEILDWHDQDGATTIGFTATPLGIGHLYDHLVVAGTNSELRECGSHVLADHYGPDEPGASLVGKLDVTKGESAVPKNRRKAYVMHVFGSVIDHYHKLNPEGHPSLLFAPGVAESIWFAQELCEAGIPAAHIDGTNCWFDGQLHDSTDEVREEIAHGSRLGRFKVVTNRFVMREGIDWPWIGHGIFATVFGSLTSYLQAGGRIIRAHESLGRVTIQDHGGNWWRHGSLNADRTWDLSYNDRIMHGMRMDNIRGEIEIPPRRCPKCGRIKGGVRCPGCGVRDEAMTRPVMEINGRLSEHPISEFRPRRKVRPTSTSEKDWIHQVMGTLKSKKASMKTRTFIQLRARYAEQHNWQWPHECFPMQPKNAADWYRPVKDVPRERLT